MGSGVENFRIGCNCHVEIAEIAKRVTADFVAQLFHEVAALPLHENLVMSAHVTAVSPDRVLNPAAM